MIEQQLEADYKRCDGRQDFPESAMMPQTDDCKIALYVVHWSNEFGVTGNSWASRRKAESVRDAKIANGTFVRTMTQYPASSPCAGFAF